VEAEGSADRAGGSLGDEHSHPLISQSSERELEYACGWAVEPLLVVDGDKQRVRRREMPNHAEERDGDGSSVGDCIAFLGTEERDLQSLPLRSWQMGDDLIQQSFGEIGERGEGHRSLGLRWAARQHGHGARPGGCQALCPQRGLADPRLARKNERR